MNARRIFIMITTVVLVIAVMVGAVNALNANNTNSIATLENVRDYAATSIDGGTNYAIDAGNLFAGGPEGWTQVKTPKDVIVSAIDVDTNNAEQIYIGAANEMAVYRSQNSGRNWERYALSEDAVGGVTDIAVDSYQKLVYVGTDTAGLFRLRDVGSSLVLNAQLMLGEPVLEVVADDTGAGMAFARTEWTLYRAEGYGLNWIEVENLSSAPTALAVANTNPATVYVGTTDRGLLRSQDGGFTWDLANEGLGFAPGTRLHIDALAADPMQPDVLYVASSYIFGSTTAHNTPSTIAVSTNGAQEWAVLDEGATTSAAVAQLLPVSGETGAVYALTMDSRSPQALGSAPLASSDTVETAVPGTALSLRGVLTWVIAGLAALALGFAVFVDLRSRRKSERPATTLAPEMVSSNR
jgi:hypothetical protein